MIFHCHMITVRCYISWLFDFFFFKSLNILMQALNCILMSFFSFHFCLNKYFLQYSRLHFIGTWRNRYQKRFPRLSNEFKHTSSDLNASGVSQKNVIIHMDMVISICRAFEYNMLSFFSFFS